MMTGILPANKEIAMNEIFSAVDLNRWIRPDFVFIVPILIGVGLILKYRTALSNKLIPVFLFLVGFFIATIWGYITSHYLGGARVFDAFIIAGVSQGFVTTAAAVMIYSSYHGTRRVFREAKDKYEKEQANDV